MNPNDPLPDSRRTALFSWLLLALAAAWALLNLHRGRPASWDEWEFVRATDWVRQGQVPFRDFWEHHSPLQWYLFAPVEALAPRSGNGALLWLRWAQAPLWAAGLFGLQRWMGRTMGAPARRLLFAALLSTPYFVLAAVEYRVDTPSALLALAAVLCLPGAWRGRNRALLAGALWALVVLANLRLAPMAFAGILLTMLLDPAGRRWRLNPQALAVLAGAALPMLAWAGLLAATHAFGAAYQRLIVENAAANSLLPRHADSGLQALAPLLTSFDLPGVILMALGLAGLALAAKDLPRPGLVQALALLQVFNLVFIWVMRVHYLYHFLSVILLMVPLAGHALAWAEARFPRAREWPRFLVAVLVVQISWNAWNLATEHRQDDWAYQDSIIREAVAATPPGGRILDACGAALEREPAFEYWFTPLLVRLLGAKGRLKTYDPKDLARNPPGAVIYDMRLANWLTEQPPLMIQAVTHFLPVSPNLWLPGLSWVLSSRDPKARWVVPATAEYRILASPALAAHPWFRNPMGIGMPGFLMNPEFTLVPATFPCAGLDRLRWQVNGSACAAPGGRLQLRRGDVLEVTEDPLEPLGLMIVPVAREALFRSPVGNPEYDVVSYYKAE